MASIEAVALHGDHLAEVFDAKWSEGEDLDFFSAIDPDHAIFGLHPHSEMMESINRLAEFQSDTIEGSNGMDLVQLHDQAAWAKSWAFQFHGRSSGRR